MFYIHHLPNHTFRISHRQSSIEYGALKNFAIFSGQRLCQSLFLNKVAGLNPDPPSFANVSSVF